MLTILGFEIKEGYLGKERGGGAKCDFVGEGGEQGGSCMLIKSLSYP
jgi:hypothetical protein